MCNYNLRDAINLIDIKFVSININYFYMFPENEKLRREKKRFLRIYYYKRITESL